MTFNVQDSEATPLSRMGDMGEEKQSMNYESDTYIYKVCDPADPNDESLGWYDWLADCAMTSHICNDRNSFVTYHPQNNTVAGVGNVKAKVKGSGTVELMATYLGQSHYMKLTNVLHIPTNRNNLLSLEQLDSTGGSY
jgi:hypothetical protein